MPYLFLALDAEYLTHLSTFSRLPKIPPFADVWAEQHPLEAQTIAENGRNFVRTMAMEGWKKETYQKLGSGSVFLAPPVLVT